MNNIKKLVLATIIGVSTFSLTGCSIIEKTPEAINKSVVAKVNGESITRGELDSYPMISQQIKKFKEQYGDDYTKKSDVKEKFGEFKKQALDRMVSEKIILQKAKELKLDEKKINKEVDEIISNEKKQNFGNDQKKYDEALKSIGVTESQLKDFYKTQITTKYVGEKVSKDAKVDDKKAKKYYDENKYKFAEKPAKFHSLHILVKTEDEAKKVKERLNKGEDFGKLAKELSQDPGSKVKGGDLGTVEYSAFVTPFSDAVAKMKEGEISDPVKSTFGYHIIKVISKEPVTIKPFESVKEQIKKDILSEVQKNAFADKVAQWKKEAKIETKKYEKNII